MWLNVKTSFREEMLEHLESFLKDAFPDGIMSSKKMVESSADVFSVFIILFERADTLFLLH